MSPCTIYNICVWIHSQPSATTMIVQLTKPKLLLIVSVVVLVGFWYPGWVIMVTPNINYKPQLLSEFPFIWVSNCIFIHSFHSHVQNVTIPCRSQELLPFLSVIYPFPPTSLPSSLTSSCHLFLGLSLSLVVSKFISNTLLYIHWMQKTFLFL